MHAPLLLLAALAAFMMPSVYAGGADAAHAHAFFQFWIPGSGDALDHHGASHHGAATSPHVHTNTGCGHDHHAVTPIKTAIRQTGQRSGRARDEASVAPIAPEGGIASTVSITPRPAVPLAGPVSAPSRPFDALRTYAGRIDAPDAPPPERYCANPFRSVVG